MQHPIRIFAWGNRGRRDDGVALLLAERLEERYADDCGVIVQQYHQLGPELVEELNHCSLAIFIDAHVSDGFEEVHLERIEPTEAGGFDTHHCHPSVLLTLGRCMGFELPESVLVAIRGYDFDFGDGLSPKTAAAMARAEAAIVDMIQARQRGFQKGGCTCTSCP
ncbi:MAG: hypothetical protein AMXMBFR13_31830 [Phycisphaerae bacterium]